MPHNYSSKNFKAVIFDMDGVIVDTSHLHALAWKQMFDEFLQQYARLTLQPYQPFEISTEYLAYVEGVPRLEAINNFLASRNIRLDQFLLNHPSEDISIHTLGNRKNDLFHEQLTQKGLSIIEDTVEQIKRWKAAGFKVAVATSSRNGTLLLSQAKLLPLFDAKVDGIDIVDLQLRGKPAPDIFIKAAALIEVSPAEAVVVEDAQLGVQAGRAGGFGLVVGLAPDPVKRELLLMHGADIAVSSLKELQLAE